MRNKALALVLCTVALIMGSASSAEQGQGEEPIEIQAYFLGYDKDDLIFRIVNEGVAPVQIKGLAFNHQVLYRPLKKDAVVAVRDEENPYKDLIFRTTGDFVWSENHMEMFELAYQLSSTNERKYVRIHALLPAVVSEKELVTETVP